ncbi:MAG TPA: hypothetical protein VGH89_06680 [Pseudonocardia sp.]
MSGRSGRVVSIADAAAAAVFSIVLIFFCFSALIQLFHAAVFSPDWYRPLVVVFVISFGLSALTSGIALVEHPTASAISSLAAPLFFALALLAKPHIQVMLAVTWLLINTVAGAVAYLRRGVSTTSPSSHYIIPGHLILSIAFLPVTLVQVKLVSVLAMIVGVTVGLVLLVVCVIKMPTSVRVVTPQAGPPPARSS